MEKEDIGKLREIHRKLENFIEEGRRLLPLREKIEKDGLVWLQQLNTISQMQRLMVNEGTVVLPFKWEGHKGGMLIRTQKDEYRVFINLNYPEGFVSALLSSPAPVVLAKGYGELAERIIKIAKEKNIPIVEDKDLVSALIRVEVFEEIPPELYRAVAKVLVFIKTLRT